MFIVLAKRTSMIDNQNKLEMFVKQCLSVSTCRQLSIKDLGTERRIPGLLLEMSFPKRGSKNPGARVALMKGKPTYPAKQVMH